MRYCQTKITPAINPADNVTPNTVARIAGPERCSDDAGWPGLAVAVAGAVAVAIAPVLGPTPALDVGVGDRRAPVAR